VAQYFKFSIAVNFDLSSAIPNISLIKTGSTHQRTQIYDLLLNLLYLIKLAPLRSTPNITTTLPLYRISLQPLLNLFFLFQTVFLSPATTDEPHTYRCLIPYKLTHFYEGNFLPLYQNADSFTPKPVFSSVNSDNLINKSVESAVRNGDFSTAMS
jgi:hypothetical protein